MNCIASAVHFLMMMLTIAGVLSRKLASRLILGALESSKFMLGIIIFLTLAQAKITNGNVKVDLGHESFPKKIPGMGGHSHAAVRLYSGCADDSFNMDLCRENETFG
jgi:TRAP-type C4-dicarboxylate transport system permease small subunit